MLVALGEGGIKTLEDFAGLAVDELTSPEDGILNSFELTEDSASKMIMAARIELGWIEEQAEEPSENTLKEGVPEVEGDEATE
jgi:N utilization substance protein A